MSLSKAEKLKMCVGCEDDFYNGKNPLGVKECWMLKSAEVVRKKMVHINQRPPWKQKAIKVLSCRHEKHYIFVGEHQEH